MVHSASVYPVSKRQRPTFAINRTITEPDRFGRSLLRCFAGTVLIMRNRCWTELLFRPHGTSHSSLARPSVKTLGYCRQTLP